jgi:branched-chain amino acid transport system ATP-binding protein
MTALLETSGLHKSFGAVVAARDISVVARRGERLGLIGNNGAGKTTFVNLVTGYLKPDAGRVVLDGKDIGGLAPRRVRRHGVSRSFQIPQLFASLTPEENLLIALGVAGKEGTSSWQPARSAAMTADLEDLIARFRLDEYRDHAIAALPGGVRKLVDIAMAVTHQPKLLLLDEPTSGVSAEEKFALMDVIMRALEDSEATVLFVEHDMEVVGRYAERVLAFYEGRIIADGSPDAVLGHADVQRYVTGMTP